MIPKRAYNGSAPEAFIQSIKTRSDFIISNFLTISRRTDIISPISKTRSVLIVIYRSHIGVCNGVPSCHYHSYFMKYTHITFHSRFVKRKEETPRLPSKSILKHYMNYRGHYSLCPRNFTTASPQMIQATLHAFPLRSNIYPIFL